MTLVRRLGRREDENAGKVAVRRNLLVVLTGPPGVGKTTLGPHIAEALRAKWLSEQPIVDRLAGLFAARDALARLVAELTIVSCRSASVLSAFRAGNRTVVSERWLPDDKLFFDLWAHAHGLQPYTSLMDRVYDALAETVRGVHVVTVMFRAPFEVTYRRVRLRGKQYDRVYTRALARRVHHAYRVMEANLISSDAIVYRLPDVDARVRKNARAVASGVALRLVDRLGHTSQ